MISMNVAGQILATLPARKDRVCTGIKVAPWFVVVLRDDDP